MVKVFDNEYINRFWKRVDKKRVGVGCWEWEWGKSDGYGVFYVKSTLILAHRFAYETLVDTIPDGLCLDHLCRNRSCVNPAHIEIVTPRMGIWSGSKAV